MNLLKQFALCLTAMCSLTLAVSAQDVINTVVGGGPNNLPGVNANLNGPFETAVDAAGNVYVVSYGQSQVFKISTTGVETLIAGKGFEGYSGDGGPATQAELSSPEGIAVDGATPANVYIADSENCVVRKVDQATGVISTVAGLVTTPTGSAPYISCGYSGDGGKANAAELYYPSGIAVNPTTADLYIADQYNGVIRKVAGGSATGTITTVAGTPVAGTPCGSGSPSGNGGAATSAVLCFVNGVALDTSVSPANIFISEGNEYNTACDIREVVGSSGKIYLVAGSPSLGCGFTDNVNALDAQLNNPWQLHVAVSGSTTTVDVADEDNYVIRQFSLTYSSSVPKPGTITTIAGSVSPYYCGDGGAATSACIYPLGLAYDSSGNYYIGDYGNNRIRKVTKSTGDISTIAGWGSASGSSEPYYSDPVGLSGVVGTPSLYYPSGVFADPSSTDVYVGGYQGQAVYLWNSANNEISNFAGSGIAGYAGDGGKANAAATELDYPQGVGKDSKGNMYIADTDNCVIREVSASTGDITTVVGGTANAQNGCGYANGSAASAQFDSPTSIVLDSANNIYISDYSNCAIRKLTAATGEVSTIAGAPVAAPVCGYSGDGGPAVDAELFYPGQLTLDAAGNLYFADTQNQRVREIVAQTGMIQTVAGDGTAAYNGDGLAIGRDLNSPIGVSADPNGNLFISDQYNEVLRWVTPTGEMITFAGSAPSVNPNSLPGFSGDGGPALGAQFFYPQQISRDSNGNTYLADEYNQRVRQITPFAGYGLSLASLQFPTQPAGTTSSFQPITVSAVGPTTISAITLSSTVFSEIDDCTGQPLTANQTCEIDIYFAPTAAGNVEGTLTIASNAFFASNPNTIVLTGTGAGLKLTGSLGFGTQPLKSTTPNTVTLTNSGAAVTLSKIYLTSTTNFAIVTGTGAGTCPLSGGSLAAGASCTIVVDFTPTVTGALKSTLVIESNDPASPLLAQANGLGTEVKTSAASIAFGSISYGATATSDLTISNTGSASFTLSPKVTGTGFSISSTGDTCSTSLAAGASCVLPIEYDPTAVGSNTGTLTITTNGGSSPVVPLSGTAVTEVSISATSLAFGSISYGTTATSDLTIKNVGTVAYKLSESVTGTGFLLSSSGSTCSSSLAAGASCVLSVEYDPSAVGSNTGTLTITTTGGTSPTVSLSGTATSDVTVSATSIAFGTITHGTTKTVDLTITNSGKIASLTISTAISGSGDADFTVLSTGNTCTSGVAPGKSCTLPVEFKPAAAASYSATLTITTNGGVNPTVALTGTGD